MVQLFGGCASAVIGYAAQQRHHGACRLLVEHVFDCGSLLPQCDSVGVRNFADEVRSHADTVIGEDGVGGHLLLKRNLHRAQRHRQVGRNV